jgi:hypothetical protein
MIILHTLGSIADYRLGNFLVRFFGVPTGIALIVLIYGGAWAIRKFLNRNSGPAEDRDDATYRANQKEGPPTFNG